MIKTPIRRVAAYWAAGVVVPSWVGGTKAMAMAATDATMPRTTKKSSAGARKPRITVGRRLRRRKAARNMSRYMLR